VFIAFLYSWKGKPTFIPLCYFALQALNFLLLWNSGVSVYWFKLCQGISKGSTSSNHEGNCYLPSSNAIFVGLSILMLTNTSSALANRILFVERMYLLTWAYIRLMSMLSGQLNIIFILRISTSLVLHLIGIQTRI
jgi:hypothetical protein